MIHNLIFYGQLAILKTQEKHSIMSCNLPKNDKIAHNFIWSLEIHWKVYNFFLRIQKDASQKLKITL